MVCYHEGLEWPAEPREMVQTKPHNYFCEVCGNTWSCAVCGHPPEERVKPMSEGLKAELEQILKEHGIGRDPD